MQKQVMARAPGLLILIRGAAAYSLLSGVVVFVGSYHKAGRRQETSTGYVS